jgi:hypothetical protein
MRVRAYESYLISRKKCKSFIDKFRESMVVSSGFRGDQVYWMDGFASHQQDHYADHRAAQTAG